MGAVADRPRAETFLFNISLVFLSENCNVVVAANLKIDVLWKTANIPVDCYTMASLLLFYL